MTIYVGSKIVKATPMTRAQYNAHQGWALPADQNGEDAGFLVEYLDGGAANHPDHKGYISWSPADVFAKSYVECVYPTGGLADHQVRVCCEASELKARRDKLLTFLNGGGVSKVSFAEFRRLGMQLQAMNLYLLILEDRISSF